MTKREINEHQTNECNRAITLTADERDPVNGASHVYDVSYTTVESRRAHQFLYFQHGPIREVGINGLTNEVLLAVLLDRIRGFQGGPYACAENDAAITHLECALEAMNARTREREARGVEGTHAI